MLFCGVVLGLFVILHAWQYPELMDDFLPVFSTVFGFLRGDGSGKDVNGEVEFLSSA